MANDINQLVRDVAEVTGAAPPQLMDGDAPVLQDAAIASPDGDSPYLVGLIGGKEVGKSALVNVLAGEAITQSTAYGPGTEIAVAYAHEDQVSQIRALLEREAPGQHQVVAHAIGHLRRQVLLDLPDIDSQFSAHVELTRRMLRHMLFPVWVQSIEKYADLQPQKLLAAVAAGNDPANFLFCLNKADQVDKRAAIELRDDYALRITRVLGLQATPTVYAVSALRPDGFDLPALREKLSQQKPAGVVKKSIELAGRQRDRSVLAWIDGQRLPERADRIARLAREAEELTAARLGVPLLETVVPRLLDDAQHRAAIVEEVMNARVARWPVVNVLHTLLSPLTGFWRRNVGSAATIEQVVDASLSVHGRPLPAAVQATFALLQQTHPLVSALYRGQRLWESGVAEASAMQLRDALIGAMRRQRTEAKQRLARRGFFAPMLRIALTIGAILWFPIVQPVLEVMLRGSFTHTLRDGLILAVQLLGATYLLQSATFLAIWFLFLWLVLRWDTYRRVNRLLAGWRELDGGDASMSPAAAALEWVDQLLDPIRNALSREERLIERADALRKQLEMPAA